MSRKTPGPDDPEQRDSGRAARRRRAGRRSAGANDFREMFGSARGENPDETPNPDAGSAASPDPSGSPDSSESRPGSSSTPRSSTPSSSGTPRPSSGRPQRPAPGIGREGLHEPPTADRYVRGRTRLTVRELMEQMQAEGAAAETEQRSRPTRPSRPQPAPDDSPTMAHRFDPAVLGDDVTQKIPTVPGAGTDPRGTDTDVPVDISEEATRERAVAESRGQDARGPVPSNRPVGSPSDDRDTEVIAASARDDDSRPLERTPDLTAGLRARSAPRRHAGTASVASRRKRFARDATVTGRILVATACILSLVGTGFVWGYLNSWNSSWNTINAVDPDDDNIRNKDAQNGDETYLIVGTDTRDGKNSKLGAGTTADAEGARADTVILVNVPANRSRVVAVSFPRDLQVDRPDCSQWDPATRETGEAIPAEYGVKLNSVYADGGPECLVKTLTKMSGLNINHFIAMDFYGFKQVVRTLGGVEVCSAVPLYDYELGHILRKAGRHKLTDSQALNYVRARKIESEGNGDYGRIKRQQLFLSSLLRSILSGNVLTNPNKLNSIVQTFIEYSYVDGVDTQSLLRLAESMQGIEAGRVTFLTVPTSGTATDGSNNEIPRTDDIDAIFNAIIDDEPLPGEKAKKAKQDSEKKSTSSKTSTDASSTGATGATPSGGSDTTATAQSPGNVGVRVLNGTGESGVAGEVSDELTPLGFDVRGVGDASENRDDTVIRYGAGEKNSAATLAAMFGSASIQYDGNVKSGVEVILGRDYAQSAGSSSSYSTLDEVPTAGSTLTVTQLPEAADDGGLPNDLAVTNAGDTTCA